MRYLIAVSLLAMTSLLVLAQDVPPKPPETPAAKPVDSIQSEAKGAAIVKPTHRIMHPDIGECSGLQWHDGAWWAHNDSGDGPYLYRSETLDFKTVEKLTVPGAKAVDWEETTVHNGNLLVCDIGDNWRRRSDLKLYEVKYEKSEGAAAKLNTIASYSVRYPDGKHDCEAAFSVDGKLHLIIKNRGEGVHGIYRFDELKAGELNTPEKIADFNVDAREMVTAADFDGTNLAVLTYTHVYTTTVEKLTGAEVNKPTGMTINARQSEAIAWKDGALVFANEQRDVYTIGDFQKRGLKTALPETPEVVVSQHAEAKIKLTGDGAGWKDKATELALSNLMEGEYFRWAIIGGHLYMAGRVSYTGSVFTSSSGDGNRMGAGLQLMFNPTADTFAEDSIRYFTIGEDVNMGVTCWRLKLDKELELLETKSEAEGNTKDRSFQFEVKLPLTEIFAEGQLPSEFYCNIVGRSLHEGNSVHLATDYPYCTLYPYTWSKVVIKAGTKGK
ncbi:hypothetical protein OAU50_03005 [Planctomycetota bacterium]|nr:hypothetical protein [Planctomycetota bacterium]